MNIAPLNMTLASTERLDGNGASKLVKAGSASELPRPDFANVVNQVGNDMVQDLEKAEAMSIAGMKGQASAYEVVSSIMQAEQSLRMAVGVRDKIISAYLEITRMQI